MNRLSEIYTLEIARDRLRKGWELRHYDTVVQEATFLRFASNDPQEKGQAKVYIQAAKPWLDADLALSSSFQGYWKYYISHVCDDNFRFDTGLYNMCFNFFKASKVLND